MSTRWWKHLRSRLTYAPGEPNLDGAFIFTKNGNTSTNALGSWAVTAP